jgi:hypothetical protein
MITLRDAEEVLFVIEKYRFFILKNPLYSKETSYGHPPRYHFPIFPLKGVKVYLVITEFYL